jgi:hypothetical protein
MSSEPFPESFFWLLFAVIAVLAAGGLAYRHRRRLRLRSRSVQIAAAGSVRRGDRVRIDVVIRDLARAAARLRVGVVCLERYDVEETSSSRSGGTSSRRVTREAVAHEEWRELSSAEAQQGLTFEIPPAGPFSYSGSCLRFEWRAEALELRPLRPDRIATGDFEVRP